MDDKQLEYLLDATAGDGVEGICNRCGEKTYIEKYGMCEICVDDMGA